ncbi:MAG: DNA translocase FtsK, partial [Proteobacteria bacterium]|nr:DNA translocase FtsK [Pseudomonadota bacterium]
PASAPERGAPVRPPEPREPPLRVKRRTAALKTGKRASAERQATLDLGGSGEFRLPQLSLLNAVPAGSRRTSLNEFALEQNARFLETVLGEFGIRGEIAEVNPGPVVTRYELDPAPGVKTSRVIGLADDIARSMSAISARVAVIPGQNRIGIELPNAEREVVYLRELLSTPEYEATAARLSLALGKNIAGEPVIADLARMPHLLIAGTTGSGKSVAVNTMILSLLYRLPPDQCRMIMIDPKMLELSVYDGIPHLLAPVVTEPGKAVVALKWVVREMQNRYRAMSRLGVRNLGGYNQRVAEARNKGEAPKRTVQTGYDADTGEPVYEEQVLDLEPMPFIVVIVDEMADLMMVAGKDVEAAIQRLSQMARAAGIHLIMATQRPSVDVITGTIKANFPTRVSFQVTSKIDSRTILGEQGAEQLLGQGDMLYMEAGGRIQRVHGPFVSDPEVERVVTALKKQGAPDYLEEVTVEPETEYDAAASGDTSGGDELYDEAVALVLREQRASTSFVQRHLQIGYNRAARMIERMEAEGVITSPNRVGKREVLPGHNA